MITRYALFEGDLPAHHRADFETAVIGTLLPAVRRIPGIESAAASFSRGRDPGAAAILFFLVTTYPDLDTVTTALASPERQAAQSATDALFARFGACKISHHVTETRR